MKDADFTDYDGNPIDSDGNTTVDGQEPTDGNSGERSAFYAKLSEAGQNAGYDIPMPILPEGMEFDDGLAGAMFTAAKEKDVSQEQMLALFKVFNEHQVGRFKTDEAERLRSKEESDRDLAQRWGADLEEETALAENALTTLIPDPQLQRDFSDLLNAKGLVGNATMIRVFHAIGEVLSKKPSPNENGELPKPPSGYEPANVKSPDMYRFGTDPESKKARAYFRDQGIDIPEPAGEM